MNEMSDANSGMHILELEITTRCNLNCRHCYNRRHVPIDLPLEKIFELYHWAESNRVWTFIISGGEAILHPDFKQLTDFLAARKKPNRRVILQSNGTLIRNGIIDRLKAFDLVHLSCDYGNYVRKNAYDNFAVAEKLLAQGIRCYLFVTIHKMNLDRIEELVAEAARRGVEIGFNVCIPVDGKAAELLLSPEEFMHVEQTLCRLSQEGKILRYSSPLTAVLDPAKALASYQGIKGGCSAGVGACVVAADGEVYPCPFFRLSAGNIYEQPLEEIWNKAPLFQVLRQRLKFNEPCGSCKHLSFCGGCRNRAYQNSGDIHGVDPMCYRDYCNVE